MMYATSPLMVLLVENLQETNVSLNHLNGHQLLYICLESVLHWLQEGEYGQHAALEDCYGVYGHQSK